MSAFLPFGRVRANLNAHRHAPNAHAALLKNYDRVVLESHDFRTTKTAAEEQREKDEQGANAEGDERERRTGEE